MAKVVNPLMSAQARGKVGGLIFNTHRGQNTVKGFKSPSQPRTARQLTVRSYITTLSRAWSGITQVQRDGWEDWANLHTVSDWTGTPIRMSGFDAYVKCNALLLDQSKASVASAPAVAGPTALAGFALTPSSGQISIAWTARGGTSEQVDIWLQGPISAGRKPSIVKATHNCFQAGETSPKVISGLGAGTWAVFARVVSETDGQVSTFVVATCVVS